MPLDAWIGLLRVGHILAVVAMAWPLYALITVNERAALGPPLGDRADRYLENVIRPMTVRCFVFQLTALATGVVLVILRGLGLTTVVTNLVLLAKLILLLVLMSLLGFVHFSVQPELDRLFSSATEAPITGEPAAKIGRLRLRRKRVAATCLFLVVTMVILGVQVYAAFPWPLTAALIALAALFAGHAFRTRLPLGWI